MKWYTPSTPWLIDKYQNGALTDKMTNNTGSQLHMYVVLHNFFTARKQKENKYFMNNNTGYYCYYLNVTKVFSNLVHILWLCRQLTQQ